MPVEDDGAVVGGGDKGVVKGTGGGPMAAPVGVVAGFDLGEDSNLVDDNNLVVGIVGEIKNGSSTNDLDEAIKATRGAVTENIDPTADANISNGTKNGDLKQGGDSNNKKSDNSASFLRAARAGNLEKVLEFLKTNTDINTCNPNGLNALHLASKEGHVHVVRELLERGANVDAATKKGNTALHIASLAGQEDIVRILVEHSAGVNLQSQNGFTPLYMAAQENHDSVVRYLLAHSANQSLSTEDGFTPLAVALQQGHDKVVAVLLENDTRGKVRLPALHIAAKKDDTKAAALLLHTDHNPDVTSKSGFTPLHIAAHYGNESIAALLIQRGADVNFVAKHQITPLHVASKWGKGNMVSLLLEKNANIDAKTRDGLTPLHCAARSGHETVVDMLLEKGAPITGKTKNGLAPLHMASQGDHVDAARILLYHKAPVDDVTVDFLTSLHVAAHCGHVRVAKLLLDRKADANSRALNGFTPLHIACKKNRIKVVELLLKHGASIEATTESGLTPLHVASFMGCMNIVIYLLQHGAAADVPTVRGETPLHLAARANQTDIIRILLRNGAQVDARAREQQTALHIASRLGNSDIVVLLLQHGAAVDATTKDHYTALHIAAKEGQEEVAGVLLDQGASLTAVTKKGFTPLHLAAKYGNPKMAQLLLMKDAPVDAQGKNGVTPLHVAAHYDHQNVALLLLDNGASPHATAKNGYTPLHIASRKNQMDIASTLLEYGAKPDAESKAGFTPLHLTAQEGHTDMASLLCEHGANPAQAARNGLTPIHLCAQEDKVGVAAVLVKTGATIDPVTKAGYTPLHVASHFGQMNMVRFLLQHQAQVHTPTQLGYTPLHQAAQQGHMQIVNLLLENKAEPNAETKDGKTALSIAQRLGYISVVETLKIVTETTITTSTTTTTEEKYKPVVPETMHETFMSESEDEGGDGILEPEYGNLNKSQAFDLPNYEGQFKYTSDDTMLGDQSYRYLTSDEMKSLGDDSLPIDVTRDEKMDISFQSNVLSGAPPTAPGDQVSPQHLKEHLQQQNFLGLSSAAYPIDNVDVARHPVLAGSPSVASLNQSSMYSFLSVDDDSRLHERSFITEMKRFLVSFMVDARGGAMRGCRHSGVRVIIPPRKAAMPMRITCRYLKKDKLVHAPPLMEGEALASRILEMGPTGAKFLGPVILEVPHFASLRGKEREIVILRSDNGETWREHTLEATEDAVQEVLNESFDGEELKQLEDLNTSRITRILTTDFPQYFAIVTRIRQEVHAIGPDGGMVSSTVVPQVQAVFPQGALTKKIKVGLQAQPISPDLAAKLLGNRVAVSPIVTVEPRRRKFHKPITLTLPVPQAASKGMINQYSGDAPTLRLLCSITGGTTRAQWEDVTGSTPLTFVNDCVSFTTTVSARFWLMDCSNIPEATRMATELYREAIHVPFMSKFCVFAKRHQLEEARMRVFCMTDDREDKTLETQEQFIEVAKSRDVEVLEGKTQYLEFAGNIVPVTKSGDQLAFNFYAFRENRLPFTVRVKDQHAENVGRIAFMRQPKVGRGDAPQTPICNLNIALPETIQPEPAPSEPDLLSLEKKYTFLSISKADTIHKADLRLSDISNMLDSDWVSLARELDISDSDINIIKSQYPENAPQQALVMLRLWMQTAGNKATGNTLEKALRKVDRVDIVNLCIFNVEPVTDDKERAVAKAHIDTSVVADSPHVARKDLASLNRDASMDVSYDEHDLMKRFKDLKEAESADEDEDNQKSYQQGKSAIAQAVSDLSPTYESEEKKYAAEEKVVAEDNKPFKTQITQDFVDEFMKDTEAPFEEKLKERMVQKEMVPMQYSDMSEVVEEEFVKVVAEKAKEEPDVQMVTTVLRDGDTITKTIETISKVESLVEEPSSTAQKDAIPEKDIIDTTVTKRTFEDGSQSIVTTKTTHRTSFTIGDDDESSGVQEKIVVEKRVDSDEKKKSPTSVESAAKTDMLQRLGEELGKLDDRLEEKFKEKRRTDQQPDEAVGSPEAQEAEVTVQPRSKASSTTPYQVVDDQVVSPSEPLGSSEPAATDEQATSVTSEPSAPPSEPAVSPGGSSTHSEAAVSSEPAVPSEPSVSPSEPTAPSAPDLSPVEPTAPSEPSVSPSEATTTAPSEPAAPSESSVSPCEPTAIPAAVESLDVTQPLPPQLSTSTSTTSNTTTSADGSSVTVTTIKRTTTLTTTEEDTDLGAVPEEFTQTSVDKMAALAAEVTQAEAVAPPSSTEAVDASPAQKTDLATSEAPPSTLDTRAPEKTDDDSPDIILANPYALAALDEVDPLPVAVDDGVDSDEEEHQAPVEDEAAQLERLTFGGPETLEPPVNQPEFREGTLLESDTELRSEERHEVRSDDFEDKEAVWTLDHIEENFSATQSAEGGSGDQQDLYDYQEGGETDYYVEDGRAEIYRKEHQEVILEEDEEEEEAGNVDRDEQDYLSGEQGKLEGERSPYHVESESAHHEGETYDKEYQYGDDDEERYEQLANETRTAEDDDYIEEQYNQYLAEDQRNNSAGPDADSESESRNGLESGTDNGPAPNNDTAPKSDSLTEPTNVTNPGTDSESEQDDANISPVSDQKEGKVEAGTLETVVKAETGNTEEEQANSK